MIDREFLKNYMQLKKTASLRQKCHRKCLKSNAYFISLFKMNTEMSNIYTVSSFANGHNYGLKYLLLIS